MSSMHPRPTAARLHGRPILHAVILVVAVAAGPGPAAADEVRRAGARHPAAPFFSVPTAAKGTVPVVDPGPILLVDDDDDAPDVRAAYTDALDALDVDYDVWNTDNSDDMEPDAAELAAYDVVIWFSGAAFTDPPPGVAGPGAAGEAALASFLDGGGCLLISSQDYLFDHADVDFTPFMTDRLGIEDYTDEAMHTTVVGVGPFDAVGPSTLTYPSDNFSDELVPDGTAEPVFFGQDGFRLKGEAPPIAGIAKVDGGAQATLWGFPFEALPAADREQALAALFAWCGGDPKLSVTLAGPGSGTVTSSPAGIDCGADCSETYFAGTEVTLTATPDDGSTFAGWSGGGCSGTGTCVLTLDASTTVTAVFDGSGSDPVLTVTRTGDGSGTVTSSPAGIDCGGDCSEIYLAGTEVTLTATPDGGSTFAGWSGGGCSGTGTCVLTLDASTLVTAAFDLDAPQPALTVIPTGAGSGTVTSAPAGIDCGVLCSATFDAGTELTLTATADGGSTFAGWSGGGCSGTGTCVLTLGGDAVVAATFDADGADPTLTVIPTGAGSGTVASAPAGIDCGALCSAAFAGGTEITLTATADGDSTFAGWSGGGCSGTDPCAVTLDSGAAVFAAFDRAVSTLTVTAGGSGSGTVSSSPPGIDCGADCAETYPAGTEVTLTAAADPGSVFTGWSGGGCSGTDPCTVTVDGEPAVLATFERIRTLTVTRTGAGSGGVTSSPAGIDCGPTCAAGFVSGTEVTLTAAADPGSVFTGWSGGGCSGVGACVLTLEDDADVAAAFAPAPATLDVVKTGQGAGTVTSSPAGIACGADCSGLYPPGLDVTLTAAAEPGSRFDGWSGGGCSGTGACVVSLAVDTTVTAAFSTEGPAPALTVHRNGSGTGTVTSTPAGIDCGLSCAAGYATNTGVTLTAAPDPGSSFSGWSGDCSGTGTCAVTLDRARAVRATFSARGPYPTLTVHRTGTGTGTVTSAPSGILCGDDCSQSYPPDTLVRLTAVPAPGSIFTGWAGDCGGVSCAVTLGSFNQSVTAVFEEAEEEPCAGALCLGGGDRFQVDVAWRAPSGEVGVGRAVPFRSADSGILWFFAEDNWEMLVKVLDGCGLNRHFWVFAAAGTNVEYTLTVTDTVTGVAKSYFNPQGNAAASITDTAALAVCDAPGGAQARVEPIAPERAFSGELGKQGECVAAATTLCLGEDRFAVEVDWRTAAGGAGPGRVVPFATDDSGLFYFFTENNWEMLVKVLDHCGVSGRYWVFATAVTDTGFTLRVTDTESGQVREYVNPVGQPATAITDVDAFATCP